MATLNDKTVFITGGSRGIGRAIALKCAADGANVVIAAKTDKPHPKLPGTIFTVAEEIERAGGKALPLKVDVREDDQIVAAVDKAASTFGGIDILINNAGAIQLTDMANTPARRLDLMMALNFRAPYLCAQACVPHMRGRDNPHILNLSPPLNMAKRWFREHIGYTVSKYDMSMLTIGLAEEFREDGIAANSLWPATTIATAAIEFNFAPEMMKQSRKPEIMADAAHAIFLQDATACSGNHFLDEDALTLAGITDLDAYAVEPGGPLMPDLFIGE